PGELRHAGAVRVELDVRSRAIAEHPHRVHRLQPCGVDRLPRADIAQELRVAGAERVRAGVERAAGRITRGGSPGRGQRAGPAAAQRARQAGADRPAAGYEDVVGSFAFSAAIHLSRASTRLEASSARAYW